MMIDHTRRRLLASIALGFAAGAVSHLSPKLARAAGNAASTIRPFKIRVDEATLARIRQRVREVQWPRTSRGAGWRYGVDAQWFRELVTYWGRQFDWRTAETRLNKAPQYLASVDGRDLHYARLQPSEHTRRAPPIMLLHGWPYSFATMLPLAERLTSAGFEVVVPSLPGNGFSSPADDQIRGLRFIARRLDRLMTDVLGHARYLVQGGDHGAVVADWMALDAPQHLLGMHVNTIAFRHAGASYGSGQTGVADAAPDESAYVRAEVELMERESAYFRLQYTRPETLVYALSDSPVGWAAYMLDKWQKWTDTRIRPFETIYTRDQLLTEVMLYLVGDSVATAMWPYAGFRLEPFGLEPGQRITVPFGYSSFSDPLLPRMPRRFIERSRTDIRLWREHERGGHFPMLEETQTLADDVLDFAGLLATQGRG
jgi:pimeloyl-ACP methyl ester carboxylesterase